MEDVLPTGTRLGRYEIVRRLATGGMAEIYLARMSGPAGFAKHVVLKRILPSYARDDEFVRMFYNEARYAATLDHPNIVKLLGASPEGHTPVRLESITLRAPSCGPLGAQAELVVRETGASRGPSLRGPVVGAFFAPDDYYAALNRAWRDPIPDPTSALEDSLVGWTRRAMDSLVALRATARDLPLTPAPAAPLALNGLEDDDAADLQPFRLDDGRIRYAVSLRERRRTAQGTEVLAAIVMAWDATGAWQQVIFRPTLLEYRRNRLVRGHGTTPPLFWRRLAPVSGFAYGRDYLWMEQVDVEAGRVLWVILEPRSNTVVAAADMDGPC